jgi:uncharacterized protein YcbK (DUF882 family)
MQLSENFSLKELLRSDTATRKGIVNEPDDQQLENLKHLAQNILQPVRDQFGSTTVNSGLRVLELNRAIGSSDTSQHAKGEAADIECRAVSNLELAQWIRDDLDFDQVILEAYDGVDPRSGWVHVSYKADGSNRKKCLTATFTGGKAHYSNGLPD